MYQPHVELGDLKSVLRSVLVSSKKRLTPRELQRDFRRVEGKFVPYRKFGFATFEDFLQSIPDICSIQYENDGSMYVVPVVTESLKYIAELVSKQKKPDVNIKSKKSRSRHIDKKFIPAHLQHHLESFVRCHPKGAPVEVLHREVLSKFPHILQGFDDIEEILDCANHILRFDQGYVFPIILTSKSCYHSRGDTQRNEGNDCQVLPENIVSNIKSLIKAHPNGILASDFASAYAEMFNSVLNIMKYGYINILSVVSAYPEILHCFRVTDDDFIIIEAPKDLEENSDATDLPEAQTMDMLVWLIRNFPDGLNSNELEEEFEVNFLRSLNPKHLGYSSLEELLHYLESESLVTLSIVKKNMWVYPVFNFSSCNTSVLDVTQEEVAGDELESIITSYYPPGALLAHEEVPCQQLPDTTPGFRFEVVVSDALSPSRFWVVLNYDSNCTAFDCLVDAMQSFYSFHGETYKMNETTISVGHYCVCPYKGQWHRARISNITNVSEVQVQLIDIGTVRKKKKEHLRYLARDFADLPSQALCCRLAGTAATRRTAWPYEIKHLFVEAVIGRAFTATLVNISQQSGILSVDLFEVSDEDDDDCSPRVADWLARLEELEDIETEERNISSAIPSLQEQLQKFTCI
uniref:Tudor domain-containing protein Tdr5 n=1 Tax=Locusta migratoria TaxID=7004 RepID=A0AAU7J943_LOCMI